MDQLNSDPPVIDTGDQDDSTIECLAAEVEAGLAEATPSDAEAASHHLEILASLPADLRAGYPAAADYGKRTDWLLRQFTKAVNQSALRTPVPVTDTKPPTVTTPEPDYSGLTAIAKISRGYKN